MFTSCCVLLLLLVRGTLLYTPTTPYQEIKLQYKNCGYEFGNKTKCEDHPNAQVSCFKSIELLQCFVKDVCNTIACQSFPSRSVPSPAVAIVAGVHKHFFLDELKKQKCTDPDQVLKSPDLGARHPNVWGHACPRHPAKLREMWYTGGHVTVYSASLWAILLNLFFGLLGVAFLFYNVYKWLNLGPPLSTSVTQWAGDSLTSASETVARNNQAEETSMTPGQGSVTGSSSLAMTPQQHSMAASTSGSQTSLHEQTTKPTAEEVPGLASTSAPINAQPLASQMISQETAQQVALPPSVQQQANISPDGTVEPEQPQEQLQVLQPQVQTQQQSQVQPQPQQNSQVQSQVQSQPQAQQQAQPQPMVSNELPSDGSSPLAYQPTAQENPALGQPDNFYPQQQFAYPPRGPPPPGYSGPGPSGFPPRSAGLPPRPGGYPPGPNGFPPGPRGYPPRSAGYAAPGPGGFPPRSAGFPPGPRCYPPRSAGYPVPGPRGFPPQSTGFPPRPGGFPPPPGGYGRGMPGPRSASGGQWPGAFPPRSPGLPPGNRGYAPGPRGFPPGPGGFPPRSAGYAPPGHRGYAPAPGGFPPRSAGYDAPGPGGVPPRSAGFDPRMARPGSASGGQWPRPG